MNAKRWTAIVMTMILAATALPAAAQLPDEGVAVTVYNGGYGVVRELRKLTIGADGVVKFTDVATAIDATTVHFKSITDPGAKLLEQNYQYDLVSADKLLHKYIDREIEVICEGKTYAGTLLSYDGSQIVLKDRDGGIVMVQRYNNVRDIRFSALPGGLLTRPTLVWQVATQKPGDQLAEVTYQTYGLNWHAEYVLVLNGDDTAADLSGWVSVENTSGKTYTEAKMKFIAGDVRRIQPDRGRVPEEYAERLKAVTGSESAMAEKAFFEYHMYTLPRPSTVANNETKQLEMFTPVRGLAVEKKFLYSPLGDFRWDYGGRYDDRAYGATGASTKVNVFVEFENTQKNGLGIPLPAGKIRVYKQDPDDEAMEFIGEEQIDHTPKDERLSLYIGNAFDIVGERKQTDFKVESGRHWMQETIEVKVRNHKEEPVTVRIREPMYRWVNWRITNVKRHVGKELVEEKDNEKTQDLYEKLDARTVAFDVEAQPDNDKHEQEVTITYTVEYTW